MNILKKCDSCHGQKTLLSMGGMTKPCHYCKGIGYKEVNVTTNDIVNNAINADTQPSISLKDIIKAKNKELDDNVNQAIKPKIKRKYKPRFISAAQLNV